MGARQSTKGKSNEFSRTWETEVSYGGEADLHRHQADCEKNPGHLKFVPVDKFNVEHLPSGCQDNDLVDLVRVLSNLTVRVSVTSVSRFRPKTVPGSNMPYSCYTNKGSDMMRVGTGCVSGVVTYPKDCSGNKGSEMIMVRTKYTNGMFTKKKDYEGDSTCECNECLSSPTPKPKFARIYIDTAAHVVYDQLEGAHTSCHLFFDRGGTPDTCSGVVTLSGMSVVWSDVERDFCYMSYDTHDLYLVNKLVNITDRWKQLYQENLNKFNLMDIPVPETYKGTSITEHYIGLTIIVSHPHGCSKQVSVGYRKKRRIYEYMYELTYKTATCPGCSGAPVFLIKMNITENYVLNHHIGNCEWNRELNYCGNMCHRIYPMSRGLIHSHYYPDYEENIREIKSFITHSDTI